MDYITKRMSLLAKVQRGLDRSHPEFKERSIDALAKPLSKAIAHVKQLEQQHDQLSFRAMCARSTVLDVIYELEQQHGDKNTIAILYELVSTLDGEEG